MMSPTRRRKLFVNLPVTDLARSRAFFTALGFTFDERFCGEDGLCMEIGEDAYAMLLTQRRFADFTVRPVGSPDDATSGIFALTADSRDEVDAMVATAVAHGGSEAAEQQDHGFMYGWSFFDPDGHHWEVFHMEPAALAAMGA
jgi:predicted lactoylglutathione lyase